MSEAVVSPGKKVKFRDGRTGTVIETTTTPGQMPTATVEVQTVGGLKTETLHPNLLEIVP